MLIEIVYHEMLVTQFIVICILFSNFDKEQICLTKCTHTYKYEIYK